MGDPANESSGGARPELVGGLTHDGESWADERGPLGVVEADQVMVTAQARMAGLDGSLEEAARDLGAGAWGAFRLVTLPALLPGLVSSALLCFALSIDDYVITSFNAGRTVTFPLWVYSASRTGIPPQVNVMGTLIFLGGLLIAGTNVVLGRRRPT